MESRIRARALSLLIAGALIAASPIAWGATSKPTPKTTVKVSKKPTPKVTPKATKKATPKKTVAKKKAAAKKSTVRKKKVVKVSPSPKPVWPPTQKSGFSNNSGVYAKVPTTKELVGIISAAKPLAAQVKKCSTVACGAVQVASSVGCTWWEITSTVWGLSETDGRLITLGALRTTAVGTKPKEIVTVLLISAEPLKPQVAVKEINVNCYHSPITGRVPSNSYVRSIPSPTPTTSPTESSSPSPTS